MTRKKKPEPKTGLQRNADNELAEMAHRLEIQQIELDLKTAELRQREEELELSRSRLVELYENAPASYFSVDVYSGRILEMNLAAAALLKTTREKACRKRFTAFVAPEMADAFHICSRRALRGLWKESCELKMRRADGSAFWALLEMLGNQEANQVRMALADITESKKVQQVKDDFIGMVSHELRTPLTVVMSAVEVARCEEISEEERRELLQEAAASSQSLSHILDNLIEVSRYQAGRLQVSLVPANLRRILEDVAAHDSSHLNAHRLLLDVPAGLPDVMVDAGKLRLVLRNLLDNAAKYSPAGSEIRVSAEVQDGHLLVWISDQGKGLAPGEKDMLFQPFERLRESALTRPGLGLGLLVCRHLVEAHGGKIWVESEPGKGSTFYFTISGTPY